MDAQFLDEVLIKDEHNNAWLRFCNPVQVVVAWQIEDVKAQLELIDELSHQHNYYAAGYLSYEASEAFDPAFVTKLKQGPNNKEKPLMPLLCFGLYKDREYISRLTFSPDSYRLGEWEVATEKPEYMRNISDIKARIEGGETYQVNYTIRQQASFQGSASSFFSEHAKNASYGAFIDTKNFAICSASPELFFTLRDGTITSKPMKGTAARGLGSAVDQRQKRKLFDSEKDRAENIMIVDMIRNDFSKIAEARSIKVSDHFKIEQHDTVWQMTTTVSAKTQYSLAQIMSALFPCASITGAPKVKAMEIIDQLETGARNIYTGTIGYLEPCGNAQFNVAIRTALIDKKNEKVIYGIGGGIVADSDASDEYDEAMLKARVISKALVPDFSMLETLLWTEDGAYFLLDEHLKRMSDSAAYFGFPFSKKTVLENLRLLEVNFTEGAYKLRILSDKNGFVSIDYNVIVSAVTSEPIEVCLALQPINSQERFLYHKSTHRQIYQQALDACPEYSDVLLWNEHRELTETCIANIVVRKDGKLLTPPVKCGLLAGTYRQYLLDRGEIEEAIICIDDLDSSSEVYRINSVRKWQTLHVKEPYKV
ncbi:MAG: para-aminobenzoate synthetase/4-amino-4-deoxychorismate lyase [Candidatus Azotimanducaceae bacterium]|jgi:para-aminobenzoate synthetase/4-amino-4-deoxychorismate lyase